MTKVLLFTVYDHVGLGLRILGKILEDNGYDVTIAFLKKHKSVMIEEPNKNNTTYEYIWDGHLYNSCFDVVPWTKKEINIFKDLIREKNPDIIGIGSRSILDEENVALLKDIQNTFPDKLYIGGGFGPSLNPAKYLEVCDFVILGEGEDSLLKIVDAFPNKAVMSDIPGIAYLDNGELVINKHIINDFSIDKFPFPIYGSGNIFLIDDNQLVRSDIAKDERVYCTLLGRGCVAKCSYCCSSQWQSMYNSWGSRFPSRRNRSIDNMIEELKRAKKMGFVGICFADTYLVASSSQLIDLFRRIKEEVGLPFDAHLHLEQVMKHRSILDAAIECGLTTSTIGIQYGSENVAHNIYNRKISNSLMLDSAKLFLEKGLNINYATIEGNPLVSDEDFEEHLHFLSKLPFDINRCRLCVHKLKNLPGTPLTKRIELELPVNTDTNSWYYRALLSYARVLLDDEDFKEIRNSKFFEKKPKFLEELLERFSVDKALKSGDIIYNELFIKKVYQRYLMRHNSDDVIVWWSKEHYHLYKDIFESHRVIALINSDSKFHGNIVDGIKIVGPDFLSDKKDVPVFICSPHKKAIVERINDTYSPGHLLY